MQGKDVDRIVGIGRGIDPAERDLLRAAAALGREVLARVVDEDAAHQLRGETIELGAVLPLRLTLVHETHVGLVHEGGRLERVAGILAAHRRGRPAVQLGVDDGKQALARGLVALAPGAEHLRDIGFGGHVHSILGSFGVTRKSDLKRISATSQFLPRGSRSLILRDMKRAGILAICIALVVMACKPEWTREEPIGGKSETLMPCDVGPSGRFVVSPDSVGQFEVATAIMDDVVSSCGSASATLESTCCGMAVLARLDYPGAHVAAEQESRDTVARPLSPVRRWEVSGDSVYIAGVGLMPTTVAELSRRLGKGWAENPDHEDNDGPQAHICALPNMAFRITVPASQPARKWLVDTSGANAQARVVGMIVVPARAASRSCESVTDSLR